MEEQYCSEDNSKGFWEPIKGGDREKVWIHDEVELLMIAHDIKTVSLIK